MSVHSPDSGQSSVQKPGSGFAFSHPPAIDDGPETVLNPGPRDPDSATPLPSSGGISESRILNRLFPPEFPPEEGRPPEPPAGVQLGHFLIEELIGRGGMGAVFRARDVTLDRTVALKILAPSHSHDPASVQRFQNEARAAARLDHENIARVFYFGEDRGLNYIAYEYITGTNIRDRIRRKGRLDVAEAVNYALQVASALNHTSSVGVVHRDIKPSNIIITPTGRAKLVDLGLARKKSLDSADDLTTAGTTLGTFDYISPEQAKDPRNVDVRSDIYSLGCTLYHMLTGDPPYPEGTVLQKLLDHQGTNPPDPCRKNRRIPVALGAVVQKMMSSDPRRRYPTPDELIRDLLPFVGQMSLHDLGQTGLVWTTAESKLSRFWERHLGWLLTASILLLVVFLIDRFPGGMDLAGAWTALTSTDDSRSATDPAGPDVSPPDTGASEAATAVKPSGNGSVSKGPVAPVAGAGNGNLLDDPELNVLSDRLADDVPFSADPGDSNSAGTAPPSVAQSRPPVEAIKPLFDPPPPPPTIAIVSADGVRSSYKTLEAAVSDARDGDVIELNRNGVLPVSAGKPLKVTNKSLTIRAGEYTARSSDGRRERRRYRPLIELVAEDNAASAGRRMMTLSGGEVNLIHVDLLMTVDEAVDMAGNDRAVLFSCQGADTIRLEDVGLTVVNHHPQLRTPAVFEIASAPGTGRTNTMMRTDDAMEERQGFHCEIVNSFVRGGCNLLESRFARPGRLEMENSVVAVEQSVLALSEDEENEPPEFASIIVNLDHVTCLVGNGLFNILSGDQNFTSGLVPVEVNARNNVIDTHTSNPLVTMTGRDDLQDVQRLLRRFNESRNFYGAFDMFWLIRRDPTAEPELALDYYGWHRVWGRSTANLSALDEMVVWEDKERWQRKPFSEITAADLELDPDAGLNPAAMGSDDGKDAGADLSRFRQPEDAFPRQVAVD